MSSTVLRKFARAGRNKELSWRYLFNLGSTISYQFARQSMSAELLRVNRQLKHDGMAVTSAQAMLGQTSHYEDLVRQVDCLESNHSQEILKARQSAEDISSVGHKTFNLELLGSNPKLDLSSAYAKFVLQEEVLQTANAYFGMYTRLRYYNVWHTLTTTGDARESQLWHRDREDFHILKMFLYLSDVDEGSGAFTYALGSHKRSNLPNEPEHFLEGAVKRSTDDQMSKVVPQERWRNAVGRKGTIVFADTSGYHKGGLARDKDRIMFIGMFTSSASQSKELFQRSNRQYSGLRKEVEFAIA